MALLRYIENEQGSRLGSVHAADYDIDPRAAVASVAPTRKRAAIMRGRVTPYNDGGATVTPLGTRGNTMANYRGNLIFYTVSAAREFT